MVYVNPIFLVTQERTAEQIINFFKNKQALSYSNAIEVSFNDLKKVLEYPELLDNNFSAFAFIKKTASGKFYLDELALKSQKQLAKRIFMVIFVIISLILILSYMFFLI